MSKNESLTGNDPFDHKRISLNNGLQQGDYYIGPSVNFSNHARKDISEFIAKREDLNDYVLLKVLHCTEEDTDDHQGKVFLHNEHLILSLLQDQTGIIHHHGLFKHQDKFILVLDCLMAHNYCGTNLFQEFINLQQYVIQKKKLHENEALEIFFSSLATLKELHKKNIVHRDIKLGNMVYDKRTKSIILINFGLSKHLVRDDELLTDQCGSLAYVSPDILSGRPYDGKASDMWAMGVLLYTMIQGQFPFYDTDPQKLFKKICTANFNDPSSEHNCFGLTFGIIKKLLERNPQQRLTSLQCYDLAQQQLTYRDNSQFLMEAQVVPGSEGKPSLTDCVVPEKPLSDKPDLSLSDISYAMSLPLRSIDGLLFLDFNPEKNVEEPFSEVNLQPFENNSAHLHFMSANSLTLNSLMTPHEPLSNCANSFEHLNHTVCSRNRRNSHGSESRRRHSSAVSHVTSKPNFHRQRRRSHDIRDDQSDLLERLHFAATRRRSVSAPFPSSSRQVLPRVS